jgi:hypothetical protein
LSIPVGAVGSPIKRYLSREKTIPTIIGVSSSLFRRSYRSRRNKSGGAHGDVVNLFKLFLRRFGVWVLRTACRVGGQVLYFDMRYSRVAGHRFQVKNGS